MAKLLRNPKQRDINLSGFPEVKLMEYPVCQSALNSCMIPLWGLHLVSPV